MARFEGLLIMLGILAVVTGLATGITFTIMHFVEDAGERRQRILSECQSAYGEVAKGLGVYLGGADFCYTVDESGVITFLELPEAVEAE